MGYGDTQPDTQALLPGAQSESAQSKMLSGIGGFVLGLIFLGLGLIIRHRSQKGKALWGNGGEGLCLRPSAQGVLRLWMQLFPSDPEKEEAGLVVGGDGTT